MAMPSSSLLGLAYGVSELGLSLVKRARGAGAGGDRGSIFVLWGAIALGIGGSMYVRSFTEWAKVPALVDLRPLWLGVFVAGLALRWWAIVHLGRFFTVNVTVTKDQHVVETGPYRFVRHPSYTGALVAFLGYALYVGHWIGLLIVMTPITLAFALRIRVEEAALTAGLGEPYRRYAARTKRLVPGIY